MILSIVLMKYLLKVKDSLILLIHALEKSISSIPKVTLIFDKTVDDCSLFDFNAIVGIHENFSSFNF